jgi:hypothetical protein
MKHNYTIFYILDTPENLDELYTYDDIATGGEIASMNGEEPSADCLRKILDYSLF